MEVIVGSLAGFCNGVRYAVSTAETIVNENKDVYCLGELVHNKQVIEKLEKCGMKTINSIEEAPDGSSVIIRAHGEKLSTYEKAKEKNIKIFDLTCGKVRLVHNKIESHRDDSFIIILGSKKHPEIIASISFALENGIIVETVEDIKIAVDKYKETNLKNVYVCAQTTYSMARFEEMVNLIKEEFKGENILIDNTICDATENRQRELKEMSKNFHKMIIIGGKNSSNTKELFNIAKEYCEDALLIETVEDLKEEIEFLKGNEKIGIMAGASTPQDSIDEVKKYLENI